HLSGVSRITPLTTGEVVMQSAGSVGVGVMRGIDPDEADPLTPFLINVKQQQLRSGQYNVIVGAQLAGQLGLKTGEQVRMMVPSAS
ncbi:lipoprotein-releasing system transmembrane subunit LolC, partial [Erwinia amylovora]|nr:lipoprotein-releasing system transmembrane subunit LolC [Erwinia amylovora]